MSNRIIGGDLVISANNNEEVVVFPFMPEIKVTVTQSNEEYKTADKGSLNMIGNLELKQFTMSSIFPAYPVATMRKGSVAKPFMYVDFFNKWRTAKVPFRVIASRPDGRLWFNTPMTVDSFSYELTKAGHIMYDLQMTEYRFYGELK